MTLARRTLAGAPAALPLLLSGLLVLIAGLSPHATAAVRDLPATVSTAQHNTLTASHTESGTRPEARTAAPTGAQKLPEHAPRAGTRAVQLNGQPAAGAVGTGRADAGQSCRNHDPVHGPPHLSHLRLRGAVTDKRPVPGPDGVIPPHLDGHRALVLDRPHGFDARPRCLTRRTAAQTSALLRVFRC